ncbi:6-bladed beta-propeller [candidate division KSB1 bacterium]
MYFRKDICVLSIVLLIGGFLLVSVECNTNESNTDINNKDQADNISLIHNKTIGNDESADENYLLFRPSDVTVDSTGNVYVLDSGNYRIQKYDSNGNYAQTIGDRGQGPGEFNNSFSLRRMILRENEIFVFELIAAERGKIHVFSTTGKFLRQMRVPFETYGIEMIDENKFLIPYGRGDRTNTVYLDINLIPGSTESEIRSFKSESLMALVDINGNIEREFGAPRRFDEERIEYSVNESYKAIDKDKNIYLAFNYLNRIDKYKSNGDLIFSIDRPLQVEEEYHIFEQELSGRKIKDVAAMYISSGIGIDYRNRVWIPTYTAVPHGGMHVSEYKIFEIYSDNGELIMKIPVPERYTFMRTLGDRLYLIDYLNAWIHEYTIVDN